jgi:hypothetical protein
MVGIIERGHDHRTGIAQNIDGIAPSPLPSEQYDERERPGFMPDGRKTRRSTTNPVLAVSRTA